MRENEDIRKSTVGNETKDELYKRHVLIIKFINTLLTLIIVGLITVLLYWVDVNTEKFGSDNEYLTEMEAADGE